MKLRPRLWLLAPLVCTSLVSAHVPPTGDEGFEWPHWRGPERSGISSETKWKVDGKAEALWSLEVGLGYSSVAIADGRLYTMGHDAAAGLDVVWCLDAKSGEELWTRDYPAKIWKQMHEGGTLGTPTIDGDSVYTLNREGQVHRFDAEGGEIEWKLDIAKLAQVEPGTWGFAASPIVLGDELILNVGKLVVLDKQTGELKWASKNYGHSYSTPAIFDLRGTPALAVFNSDGLAILERDGGEERYFHEWKTQYDINAMTPLVIEDKVFISSGLNRGCALLRLGQDEEGLDALEVLWENRSMRNKMSGCVLIDDHLYGFDEAILKCIDLNGEVAWSERGLGNGALSAADGKLIVVTAEGELLIAKASPKGFEELSRTKVIDENRVYWTVPVLVNGLIYCRGNRGTLVCRDHRVE